MRFISVGVFFARRLYRRSQVYVVRLALILLSNRIQRLKYQAFNISDPGVIVIYKARNPQDIGYLRFLASSCEFVYCKAKFEVLSN
jgi:hypothetical protein